jgi:hypothetical protein
MLQAAEFFRDPLVLARGDLGVLYLPELESEKVCPPSDLFDSCLLSVGGRPEAPEIGVKPRDLTRIVLRSDESVENLPLLGSAEECLMLVLPVKVYE